jgi:hypothetical protein
MTDISADYSSARNTSADTADNFEDVLSQTRFIVCGGSHASRLASALDEAGAKVADLSSPGWCASALNVESSARLLHEELKELWEGETYIIYHLFDNSVFYSTSGTGEKTLPCRGTDGKYHVSGTLSYADRDDVKLLFSSAIPLFRAGGMYKKLLLTPIMRYIAGPCCTDSAHITNADEDDFIIKQGEALANIDKWIWDLAYMKRIHNFVVISPKDLLSKGCKTMKDVKVLHSLWKTADTVHLRPAGYERMAEAILDGLENTEFVRPPVEAFDLDLICTWLRKGQIRG